MIHGGIVCRPASKEYRDNFDRVFGKKKTAPAQCDKLCKYCAIIHVDRHVLCRKRDGHKGGHTCCPSKRDTFKAARA